MRGHDRSAADIRPGVPGAAESFLPFLPCRSAATLRAADRTGGDTVVIPLRFNARRTERGTGHEKGFACRRGRGPRRRFRPGPV